jgi:probable phosphomutase (TIGR03848 family)
VVRAIEEARTAVAIIVGSTFLLVRHGDTDAVGKYLAGWKTGCHLNENGRRQVRNLAERLSRFPIRAIYTSPLERTIETAEAIATPHELVARIKEGLGEFRFGKWEGMSFEQLQGDPEWLRFNTSRSSVRAPGGESMIKTQTRMVSAIEEVRVDHNGETIAIVSHCDPLRSLIASYLGASLDSMFRFEISPASVSVAQIWDDGARVLCVNHTGDIPL